MEKQASAPEPNRDAVQAPGHLRPVPPTDSNGQPPRPNQPALETPELKTRVSRNAAAPDYIPDEAANRKAQISEKKLEANRRNAQKSMGPTSEEGKRTSRMNAVTHGLLAREAVICRGDYREDFVEFQELLDDLRERRRPVGIEEELEVENIAKCHWRKIREARYTNAIIRRRTLGMRQREERKRDEELADALKHCPVRELLEETARGLQHIIEVMKVVKGGLREGEISEDVQAPLTWLIEQYPDDFAPGPDIQPAGLTLGGIPAVRGTPEYVRQVKAAIGQQLARLTRLRISSVELEKDQLDAKIDAAALPIRRLDGIARHVTSNDRDLERSIKRLEALQKARKASGRIWPATGA